MQYRNKRTGAIIDVTSKMAGDWEPVSAPVAAEKKEPKKPAAKKESKK